HARQQATLRLGQCRAGAVLRWRGIATASSQQHYGGDRGARDTAVHGAPRRYPEKPSQVATQASRKTTADSTTASGMIAHATRPTIMALATQSANANTSSTNYCKPRTLQARTNSTSENTSATPKRTIAPTISHETKLLHWIWWLSRYARSVSRSPSSYGSVPA